VVVILAIVLVIVVIMLVIVVVMEVPIDFKLVGKLIEANEEQELNAY